MRKIFLTLAAICCATMANAKVKLPAVIGDNMVLQQETDAALWGTAKPGATVTIKTTWSKAKTTVKADSQTGKWMARVATPKAGGPYSITFSDGEKLTVENVMVGEVFFCSGQSNMEMPMKGYSSQPALGATELIANAKASRPIRICNVKQASAYEVADTVKAEWKENDGKTVANTSATAYFFADALQSALDVPVGIIVSCWGGSTIETWIKKEVIETEFPEFDLGYLDNHELKHHKYHSPCLLYNGMVAPLAPYSIKGIIWYQGEANRLRPDQYIRLQTSYAKMMREEFQSPDAGFYFVQIAPFYYWQDDMHLGYFCEAQAKTLQTIPHSGMATTADIGEKEVIHPAHKKEVGQRLAWLALSHDYGMDYIQADAPVYKGVEFVDGKAIVQIDPFGLSLSPMIDPITGFEMAGEDRVFHPATAQRHKDKGDRVVVSWDREETPVAVRYCFRNWSVGNLKNNFGVPVGPFRTDDWPNATPGKP